MVALDGEIPLSCQPASFINTLLCFLEFVLARISTILEI